MPAHKYSQSEAYTTLMDRLGKRLPDLAQRIREIVDAGTVERLTERRHGRRRQRQYRKSRPFNEQELLQVAIGVLRAYMVELPACILAANEEFVASRRQTTTQTQITVAAPASALPTGEVTIEVIPETAQDRGVSQAVIPLIPPSPQQRDEQKQNLTRLLELFDFS